MMEVTNKTSAPSGMRRYAPYHTVWCPDGLHVISASGRLIGIVQHASDVSALIAKAEVGS